MKVGDLVKDYLTERIGIIVEKGTDPERAGERYRVQWTTQGLSLFRPGYKEWMMWASLEAL